MIAKVEAKALRFPAELDLAGIRRIRTFQEFDDLYTARLHGFRDADDYWTQSSARQFLTRLTVPSLLINARDDPFLPPACFPWAEAAGNPRFFLDGADSRRTRRISRFPQARHTDLGGTARRGIFEPAPFVGKPLAFVLSFGQEATHVFVCLFDRKTADPAG